MLQRKLGLLVQVVLAFSAHSAWAATSNTWTFDASTCALNCASSNTYREYVSDKGNVVKVQALYTRNGSLDNEFRRNESGGSSAVISTQGSSGIGLTNPNPGGTDSESSSPNHAVDNITNRDFLLLDFGSVVALSSFTIGWKGSDSDMSMLFAPSSWNMSANPIFNTATGTANGTSINDLINHATASWSRQNFNDATTGTQIPIGAVSSRYVLVSGKLGTTDLDDAFKFRSITGSMVPAPGTLALLALGTVGLALSRRSRAFDLA